MFSKINHVAVVSENYAQLAQFYIAAFGMRTSDKTRPGRAVTQRRRMTTNAADAPLLPLELAAIFFHFA